MHTYFSIRRNFSPEAFRLNIDYSLKDIEDITVIGSLEPTPKDFLNKFDFSLVPGRHLEDMLANNMGWNIFSSRIVSVFLNCNNSRDIELLQLPDKVVSLMPDLGSYRLLAVKKRIACVDMEESDILWGSAPNGARHILSFRQCVLRQASIPEDIDIFHLAEYPVMPVISARLAKIISLFRPSGFVGEIIRAQ